MKFLAVIVFTDNPGGLPTREIVDAPTRDAAMKKIKNKYDLLSGYTVRPLYPTDYQAILFWGKQLGSYGYYIINEQEKALRTNAPLDATFLEHRESANDPYVWNTISNTQNPAIPPAYKQFMKEHGYEN
jgi:hypothetical protein